MILYSRWCASLTAWLYSSLVHLMFIVHFVLGTGFNSCLQGVNDNYWASYHNSDFKKISCIIVLNQKTESESLMQLDFAHVSVKTQVIWLIDEFTRYTLAYSGCHVTMIDVGVLAIMRALLIMLVDFGKGKGIYFEARYL